MRKFFSTKRFSIGRANNASTIYENPSGTCSTRYAIFTLSHIVITIGGINGMDKYYRTVRTRHICYHWVTANDHRMAMQLKIITVLTLCFVTLRGQNMVSLPEGDIIGTTMMTRKGRNISAYIGIPYAEPPVGDLRFKHTERKMKFDDVLPGDTDGNVCPQLNNDGTLIGDEDCLFLNVYTPEAITGPQYPVMVFFHGGYYINGSGSSEALGPQYLLDRNIVLVTLNYRLGALGFLSTGDEAAPGNFGLKDQRVALQWVQDNILAFGGDPNRVTISGEGTGAFCVNLHATVDESAGLFHQYIAQSSPANFLGFKATDRPTHYEKWATALGNKLDCPTEVSSDLIKCLRGVGVYDLVNSNDIFPNELRSISSWTPTSESPSINDRFTANSPLEKLSSAKPIDRPSMMGIDANEGHVLTGAIYTNDTIYERIRENPSEFFKHLTSLSMEDVKDTEETLRRGRMAEQFYLKDIDVNDRKAFSQAITDFATDATFAFDMYFLLYLTKYEGQSPGYEYSFDYRGTFSYSVLATGNNENIGASHGDELIYLFPLDSRLKTSSDLEFNESDEKMIDTMIDLWVSFVSTGTPMTNSTSPPLKGKPYNSESEELYYLQIGNQSDPDVNVRQRLRIDAMNLWQRFVGEQTAQMASLY